MTERERRTILVTGVSRELGRRFARAAAEHPAVSRVVGVDVVPPRGDIGTMSFVRADIRTPVIAKVIAKENVDTVVHMSLIATPGPTGGRGSMKDLNVIGTMQLLAACQQAESVRQVVVKSTTTGYGASSRDPALFTEDMEPRRTPRGGYARDVADVEGYVRGFARRRSDVCVTTLRCANVLGRKLDSPLAHHLRLPVVPTVLGYDPRLQFLHEQDLYGVLAHAIRAEVPGTFNVAGDGFLTLSQTLRRLRRPAFKLPAQLFGTGVLAGARIDPELRALLTYGRGVDTTRMRTVLGFEPRFTTADAVAELGIGLPATGGRADRVLAEVERHLPSSARVQLDESLAESPGPEPSHG